MSSGSPTGVGYGQGESLSGSGTTPTTKVLGTSVTTWV
jgi:hypothetical protein